MSNQRAYTLRLRGASHDDKDWKKKLWETHVAVNKGVKVFGDWLLTFRGGLDQKLADEGKSEERKNHRILLALSWLSVEAGYDGLKEYIVGNKQTIIALEEILRSRGVKEKEIKSWVEDCRVSLEANIRDDAVWVNRSKMFDDSLNLISDKSLNRDEIWDLLMLVFKSKAEYFEPVQDEDTSGETDEEDSDSDKPQPKGNKSKKKKKTKKDFAKDALHWVSRRYGPGKGHKFEKYENVFRAIHQTAMKARDGESGRNLLQAVCVATGASDFTIEAIKELVRKTDGKTKAITTLAELSRLKSVSNKQLEDLAQKANDHANTLHSKIGKKGEKIWSTRILEDVEKQSGFKYRDKTARNYEFAVILDHAFRHVSQAHTWIKRAEASRNKLEKDKKKISSVPDNVRKYLDNYCEDRAGSSGAHAEYVIRRNAVQGWKEIVKLYADCKTEEDRINHAKEQQDEIKKFGDINLFTHLAEEDARCLWHDGNPLFLLDYVAATNAVSDMRRFKVPAYRHPDALQHPVFCDFGNSRWTISFSIHEFYKLSPKRKKAEKQLEPNALTMKLWNGADVEDTKLHWQCKRLSKDILHHDGTDVTRADRLGRVAGGARMDDNVNIIGIFGQKDWNGRLQAPRFQLEMIAKVKKGQLPPMEKEKRIEKLIGNIKWFITFSVKLLADEKDSSGKKKKRVAPGPWTEYAQSHSLDPLRWPHNEENNKRGKSVKLMLSRLHGLRVLSVDLGHRYAAACAVWETLSKKELEDACGDAKSGLPSADSLYVHLKTKQDGKEKTVIYRRIGPDTFSNGKLNPAPWARLERQFLIKLQGEEEDAREASNDEMWNVHIFEKEVGIRTPLIDRLIMHGWGKKGKQLVRLNELTNLGWTPVSVSDKKDSDADAYERKPELPVDELMFNALKCAKMAIRRHANYARIAHSFVAKDRTIPGDRKEPLDERGQINLMAESLAKWHDLFTSPKWIDDWAREKWEANIAKMLSGIQLPVPSEEDSGKERKKKRKELVEKLKTVAEQLSKNASVRKKLNILWSAEWERRDKEIQSRHLRWLRDWILPRKSKANGSIMHVGGLSLTRIATIKLLRQVQNAFFQRLKPDDSHVTIDKGFGQTVLNTLENMRENRVKQLASRIVEAALGVGKEQKPDKKSRRQPKRPMKLEYKQCHAIVIEFLKHYRTDQTKTRCENRQLMSWAAAQVQKYLKEACELYGIHLREVSPRYTSRQDSRTGAPGIRCVDMPAKNLDCLPWMKKKVSKAEERKKKKESTILDDYLLSISEELKVLSDDEKKNLVIRVPQDGGEIFVSADSKSPAAIGLHADLNAAANIGLRALLDPDWTGRWWYVLCNRVDFKPEQKDTRGCQASHSKPLTKEYVSSKSMKKKDEKGEKINLWRDVSNRSLYEGNWMFVRAYWEDVKERVTKLLLERFRKEICRRKNSGQPVT